MKSYQKSGMSMRIFSSLFDSHYPTDSELLTMDTRR